MLSVEYCREVIIAVTFRVYSLTYYDAKLGKISAQPHTSLYIHIWGFIIQCITSKVYMHN